MTNEKMTPLSTNVVCCLLIAKRSGLCVKETEQGKQNFSKSKQTNKKKKKRLVVEWGWGVKVRKYRLKFQIVFPRNGNRLPRLFCFRDFFFFLSNSSQDIGKEVIPPKFFLKYPNVKTNRSNPTVLKINSIYFLCIFVDTDARAFVGCFFLRWYKQTIKKFIADIYF